MQVRNNLYIVSGGIYGQLGNVWMIPHDHGCILIDCGKPEAYETICRNLEYWGYQSTDVTDVLCTHGHNDHAGSAYLFQKNGAKITVGTGDAEMMRRGDLGEGSPFQNHTMLKCEPDILITEDCILYIENLVIRVITVPGHTDGSVLYYIENGSEKWLFTGDMFCCEGEKGDIAVTWWKGDLHYSSEKLGESFRKLWALKLEPNVIAGGHNNPRIGDDAKDMIMTAYKYYMLNNR